MRDNRCGTGGRYLFFVDVWHSTPVTVYREDEGLGRLLIQGKVESHGELLWCGVETLDEELPESLGHLRRRPLISRTYRFVSVGQPLMRITERFPLEDDSGKGDPS